VRATVAGAGSTVSRFCCFYSFFWTRSATCAKLFAAAWCQTGM